jgi:hypothetical protein
VKIVFSRKGFDSANGGVPSPILPDGRLLSLPIPSSRGDRGFEAVCSEGMDVPQLVADLRGARGTAIERVHLDPDLARDGTRRPAGWLPALGQAGGANTHLKRQGVGEGDVFLFYGWFRQVEKRDGRWRYVRHAPHLHVLFGWLEIGEVVDLPLSASVSSRTRAAIADHAHVVRFEDEASVRSESIYLAREKSLWAPLAEYGGGIFPRFNTDVQLTAPGRTRRYWSLPAGFEPRGRKSLSHHDNPARWMPDGERVVLETAAIGQEFVLDTTHYDDAAHWAALMIERNAQKGSNA